ncbi:type II toxin-antitoxin system Rv0910 family toxin [Actinoplanes aureus]|uniref:Crotonase/enoyl-CoA hydratase family protein n=1 Tax=Actinoplanes aureus TaxID=2792083 RepID=A0A931CIY3_9ACTN|nr:crotonase/enoyl-CoA hydratase family protein [Actinoplanes aureus]MBG0567266.1 crotonase/enoyl-CoA hydratase family protein [Actinoplanes aureus]
MLRRVLAVGAAVAGTVLSRITRGPAEPVAPPAVEPPRELAYPFSAAVQIAAEPSRVFAVLAEPARMAEWLVMHTGWPVSPPGAIEEGARFAQRVKLMGMPTEVRWTVVGLDPGRTVWLDGTGPMGIVVGFYLSLTPSGPGTLVRVDGGVEGGTADGPLGPMVARNLAEAMQKSLDRLADVVTRPAAGDSPTAARGPASGTGTTAARSRPAHPRPAPIRHERGGQDIDAWTPVIVGVGQVCERSTEPLGGDPVSLAVRALRLAAEDAGADLLARADSVGYVASVSWQYPDGAALIAETVGATPAETVQTSIFGGDGSLRLLNDAAAAIAEGRVSIALLGGAEAAATAAAAERAGRDLAWPGQPEGTAPTRSVGVDTAPNTDVEIAAGLVAPIYLYALIESAVRGKLGSSPAKHRERITELWSRFSGVAADNPHAWRPERHSASALAEPGADNRPISAPYPKLLTANLSVNQATGIIVCSASAAHEAGIPQDRWVFVHAGAHATDEWYVTERHDLASSPAIRAAGDAVLGHAGLTIDEVRHIDLYACFPSAVEIGAAELDLPLDDPRRPLTVTGGLTFAGGPGNNYTSHAVANLVPLLRADPDQYGLATALGWYLTKHAATVLSARPPRREYRDIDADLRLPRPAARKVDTGWTGPAVCEAYTVPYGRDGEPEAVIVTAITPGGDRVVRRVADRELIDRLLEDDPLGWRLEMTADGFTIADTTRAALPPAGEPPVLVEWHGPVTVIRLNRPATRNAVDLATARALERAVDAYEADPEARVAVLTGSDVAFCSGMDLKAAARGEYPVTEGRGLLGLTARPPRKPLIAAVEGAALAGGCELALAADLIVAAEDAVFGIPEVKRGLVAAAGGVLRLAQSLPRSIALELALTGAPMPARRLYDLGLVNRVTPAGKALDTALELAHDIAANAPLAVYLSKRIADEHRDWSTAEAFDKLAGIAGEVIGSADAIEGVRAYAEKRAPVWKDLPPA